jgi:hypothetical protein
MKLFLVMAIVLLITRPLVSTFTLAMVKISPQYRPHSECSLCLPVLSDTLINFSRHPGSVSCPLMVSHLVLSDRTLCTSTTKAGNSLPGLELARERSSNAFVRPSKNAIKDDPKVNRTFIIEELRDCTPKAWFNIMSGCDKVEDFLYSWPKADSVGNAICHRSTAINLQNLTSKLGKSTLEVRAAPGSVDFPEVWAWTEFMGKLMLWLSTADIDRRIVILDIWTNPNSTILDLIKQVGVSQSTVDFYVDRLSADWAVRRHVRLDSNIHRHHPFRAFLLAIENNRRLDYRIEAVDSKISQKLMGGYYGQISDALFQTLPVQLRNHPDNFLNMDTCDYGCFADKVITDAAVKISPEPKILPKVRMDDSSNTTSLQTSEQTSAAPPSFNAVFPSDLKDPFTHTSDRPTSLGSLRYPKTLDGSNIFPYGRVTNHSNNQSDGSEDSPSRTTGARNRSFAIPAPHSGFIGALSLSPD